MANEATQTPRFSFWREELKRGWRDLRGGEMSPARLGASVGMGLVVGCLPIFGLHLAIVLVLSLRFRLDGALAYLAANISNPFFAPILFTAEVQVGAWIVDQRTLGLEPKLTLVEALKAFPKYLLVGSPVVAVGLGIAIGLVVIVAVATKRRLVGVGAIPRPYVLPAHTPPWIAAVERVASRYASPTHPSPRERTQFHYVRIKLVMDPVAKLIASIAGEDAHALGEVVDIGTGRGQLPILLVELGRATRAHGFDWDEAKIEAGTRAAQNPACGELDVDLAKADARTGAIPEADTILLVDLLHYFTLEEQDAILERAAKAVRPGGRLVVREADTARGWRSFVTLLEERFFTLVRFNRGERVNFRTATSIGDVMTSAGLIVTQSPAWGRTPFSNVLIVGKRAPSGDARPLDDAS